ncbi:MAG: SagB/ThcOx family dehydrogenase [Syntrophobacteraceae bacterium]|nr:SagB/ThcOx family dehydrogenase [Syntrophobacteraceae bacterium]
MSRIMLWSLIFSLGALLLLPVQTPGQTGKTIQLPSPRMEAGRPLMQALKDRKSTRAFTREQLPLQTLSDMLWAAFGINRPETGGRTAPSALNRQEIDVYVATSDGIYLYDPKAHVLNVVVPGDHRRVTGRQSFVEDAPINLIYVADYSKMTGSPQEEKDLYAAADTGFISQNVYLFCASEGLATVVRGSIDRPALTRVMKLRPHQKIILAQTVGYPTK